MANFPYDVVLFDLDGTLTRSEEGIFNCVRHALKKMGRELPSDEALRGFIGPPLYVSFKNLLHMEEEDCLQAVKYYRERYNEIGLFENAVYTGIRSLLKSLKKEGIYLAVTTGKPQGPTEVILNHFGLEPYFSAVVGTGELDKDGGKRKQIEKALPATYRKAVLVGDSRFDVKSAHETAVDSIAVTYGYGTQEELLAEKPTYLVHTVAELTGLLCPGAEQTRGFFLSVEGAGWQREDHPGGFAGKEFEELWF